MVEEVLKSREEIINETITKYPPEQFEAWYRDKLPDVYTGYMNALNKYKTAPVTPVTVKVKAKSSLKLFLILIGILAGFGLVVYFVLINFLAEGLSFIK